MFLLVGLADLTNPPSSPKSCFRSIEHKNNNNNNKKATTCGRSWVSVLQSGLCCAPQLSLLCCLIHREYRSVFSVEMRGSWNKSQWLLWSRVPGTAAEQWELAGRLVCYDTGKKQYSCSLQTPRSRAVRCLPLHCSVVLGFCKGRDEALWRSLLLGVVAREESFLNLDTTSSALQASTVLNISGISLTQLAKHECSWSQGCLIL